MRSFWMLGASFFFALMAAFVKMGASHFSFFELVGYRSLFGVILIGGWIFATQRTIRTPYIFGHFKRSFIICQNKFRHSFSLTWSGKTCDISRSL